MRHAIAVGALVVFAVACAPKSETAAAKTDSAGGMMSAGGDVATIRSAIEASDKKMIDGFNAGDAAALASLYGDDAVSYSANSEPMVGKDAILKGMQAMLASAKFSGVSAHTDTVIVMGDLAIEFGGYAGTMTPPKGPAAQDHGRFMNLWKRQADGSWKIFRDISNSSVPIPQPK
jgi:uncharacterized protein (TIGR02246 family)